jgi:hypothetical protein
MYEATPKASTIGMHPSLSYHRVSGTRSEPVPKGALVRVRFDV